MISIIVATCNRSAKLRCLLASLAAADAPTMDTWELIVVDNHSTDDTGAVLKEFSVSGRLPLRSIVEERQGKSCAVNRGILTSSGEFLAFTDDDTVVDRKWLVNIERALRKYAYVNGFGGRVVPLWSGLPPRWLTHGGELRRVNGGVVAYDLGDEVVELKPGVPPPVGANVFFRRKAFERYGLFREDLGPRLGDPLYGEDTEFIERVRAKGERLLYIPEVLVRHPVEKDRLDRKACLHWNFRVGRSAARMAGRSSQSRAVRGIPLYVFRFLLRDLRILFVNLARGDQHSRFSALQEVAYRLGMMCEFTRLPQNFDPTEHIPRLTGQVCGEP
jgi:GT2 family glycosyltransferase